MSFRNPHLMNRDDTALIVIDVQEKLVPAIKDVDRLITNVSKLIAGAKVLGLPVYVSEQYPKGLGTTVASLKTAIGDSFENVRHEKTMFSCRQCKAMIEQLKETRKYNLLLVGIESHVCVFQSAMDFLSMGFNVFVSADAVGSRQLNDYEVALRRLEANGIQITTSEAALFEWCADSRAAEFKQISALVK